LVKATPPRSGAGAKDTVPTLAPLLVQASGGLRATALPPTTQANQDVRSWAATDGWQRSSTYPCDVVGPVFELEPTTRQINRRRVVAIIS